MRLSRTPGTGTRSTVGAAAIERGKSVLKYQTVIDDLHLAIRNGTYPAYSQLPSVSRLCERYGVSKITINKALGALEAQGLISRRRGSGSFVKKIEASSGTPDTSDTSGQMMGFLTEHRARGESVRTEVYDFSVVRPPHHVAEALDVDDDSFTYHVCRMRCANDKPLVIEYTYMPIDVITDLRLRNVQASIYTFIEQDLGLKIASAHRTIRAVMPSAEERRWLGIPEGEPLLEVEQVGYLDDGRPFEYSISRHTHDYEFHSISTR